MDLGITACARPDSVADVTKLDKIQQLIAEFAESAEPVLADFAKKFAEEPRVAFAWCDKSIKVAARDSVGKMIHAWVVLAWQAHPDWSGDQVAASILEELTDELLREVRWPDSSAKVGNIVDQHRSAALAEFMARMRES
jgi:hypothetical protein